MGVIHFGYIKAALQVVMGKDANFFVKSVAALGWRFFHYGSLVAGFWLLGPGRPYRDIGCTQPLMLDIRCSILDDIPTSPNILFIEYPESSIEYQVVESTGSP